MSLDKSLVALPETGSHPARKLLLTMTLRRPCADIIALTLLLALWALFFWRLLTPIAADQASRAKGDFSGQFVAFGGYQYARLTQGQIPLWNPYNNGGLPFIADAQAAVFYPPRLVTIALASLSGGWSYHALELEMALHVLAYTLLLYALLRRMMLGQPGSVVGGLAAAIIGGYGGFLSGYPPLQLALLEAAIWLPLGVLGVYEATRAAAIHWGWLIVAGFALGLSWMAGHPQSSYFLTLLLVAFYAYRLYRLRVRWTLWIVGTALIGLVSFGLAAVQLLPGFEYLAHTARAGFGFDAKSNGFPLQDILQFLYPGVVSVYSPLYVGLVGLVLALIALWRRLPGAVFWGAAALIALLWSFGGNSVVYPLLYTILPGLRFFRGQERAAYIVVNSLTILAGLGAAHLIGWDAQWVRETLRLRVWLRRLLTACLIFAALIVVAWLGSPQAYGSIISRIALTTLAVIVLSLVLPALLDRPIDRRLHAALIALIVVELFTVDMTPSAVYDRVPPSAQLSMTPPPLLDPVVRDTDTPFRVDGFRGLTDNYGSLYRVMDMRGISPLFLNGPYTLIEPDKINPRAWELFAVRYVYTDWKELPIPSQIVTSGQDRSGDVNLHRLTDPRPFALLLYNVELQPDENAALARARDPAFNPRGTIILDRAPSVDLPASAPDNGSATVTAFAPEALTIQVEATANAVLSIAQPHYPGWNATLDGQPAELLEAYGALDAVAVPSGIHTVTLTYTPLTFRLGAILSLVTWTALVILGGVMLIRRRSQHA